MNERMTFVSRRGRTAENLRAEWLRNLRDERNERPNGMNLWSVHFDRADGRASKKCPTYCGTLRQAIIRANGQFVKSCGSFVAVSVKDAATGIVVWKKELN